MQKWNKIGLIFNASQQLPWMNSHASVPIAENIENDLFRIYFSSRDCDQRSHTGYVVVDIKNPSEIIALSKEPVISPGALGCFDDNGTMATWLTKTDKHKYLYYIGWNLGVTVPFRNAIGLAATETVDSNATEFKRRFQGPILDRSSTEPHFVASCCVLKIKEAWFMWYLSCTEWRVRDGRTQHRYHIKFAKSIDGINWIREGKVAIPYLSDDEYAISRPSVIFEDNVFKMWYSYRGDRYRIGYAESTNGEDWERKDHLCGIDTTPNGWDSDMVEYPYVFKHSGRYYMLYNGNGYGKTGFGLAVLDT